MRRITKQDLENAIDRLNATAGTPTEPWAKDKAGKFRANIGNYHLDGAYGGWKFTQHVNEGGGCNNPTAMGFETKRDCLAMINAFTAGLTSAKQ